MEIDQKKGNQYSRPHLMACHTRDILDELQNRLHNAEKNAEETEALREKVTKLEAREKQALNILKTFPSVQTSSLQDGPQITLLGAISALRNEIQHRPEKIHLDEATEATETTDEFVIQQKTMGTSTISSSGQKEVIKSTLTPKLHFTLFLGSVRENRNGDRVKNYLLQALKNSNIDVTVFDPLEFDYTQLIQPLHYYKNQQEAPQKLRDLNEIVGKADGHIIVTPEYHASMGPSLATLMGQFSPMAFAYRPAAIIAYSKGRYGGIRAAMQLRTYLSEFGLIHVPSILAIPHVEEEITMDGKTENPQILTPTAKLIEELVWFAGAVREYAKTHELLYRGKVWSDHGPNRDPKPSKP